MPWERPKKMAKIDQKKKKVTCIYLKILKGANKKVKITHMLFLVITPFNMFGQFLLFGVFFIFAFIN